MSRTSISILLPVFADSPFLKDCLLSLRNLRTSEKTNLIVVLDRVSQINTDLVKKFDVKMPKTIITNSQFGLVNSLNLGLYESDSDLIARIDHDDMMENNRLEEQVNFLKNNPDHVLVGSNVTLIDIRGTKIRESFYPLNNDEIIRTLRHQNAFAHPSVMFRRTEAIISGMYRNFYEGAEDYDLWLRMIKTGKVANLADSLTLYRQHPLQMSTLNSSRQWIITKAVKTSSLLTSNRKQSLDQKFHSIDHWFASSRSLRIRYQIVVSKNFLKRVARIFFRD